MRLGFEAFFSGRAASDMSKADSTAPGLSWRLSASFFADMRAGVGRYISSRRSTSRSISFRWILGSVLVRLIPGRFLDGVNSPLIQALAVSRSRNSGGFVRLRV